MRRLRLTKTTKILFAVGIVLLSGALGYLIWRVNQESKLSPNDSDASSCPEGCSWNSGFGVCTGSGGCVWTGTKSDGTSCTTTNANDTVCKVTGHSCDPCKSGSDNACASIPNIGDVGPAGDTCHSYVNCSGDCGEYTFKCGTLCYKADCGASACSYVAPTKYTLTYTAGAGGSITGTKSQSVEKGKSGSAVTAVPNTGYTFTGWSDSVSTASRTDSNVQGNISVTANFAIKTFTLTYIAGEHGSLTGTKSQTVNYNASGSKVTAVPDTNYRFSGWSDGLTTTDRTDANVTASKTLTASFTIIGTYSLNYSADEHGSISGETHQTGIDHGSDGTEVEAIPEDGYYFVKWSDNLTTAKRTDTNVTADINVVASFSANCGNGVCGEDEDANNCPTDCEAKCGDGYCTHDETYVSCPSDCKAPNTDVPQTGIFDSTEGKIIAGVVLLVLGAIVYNIPYMSITVSIKNGKMHIKNRNIQKSRNTFEKRFR